MAPTPRRGPVRTSRRTFLAGAGAAGALLAAGCGSSNDVTAASTSTSNPSTLNLALRFDPNDYVVAGIPQRLVASVLDNRGEPPESLPATLDFQVTRDGQPVGERVATAAHDDGVPVSYFPVRTTIAEPGTYALSATVDGTTISSPFMVSEASASSLVQIGQPLPVVDTPTVADARGVDPICTRKPDRCPYHELDLSTALAAGTPVALLVSTPQFCQIGVCGPVLNLLMETRVTRPEVTSVHAEVYASPEGPAGETAPVVAAMGMTFEPSLFVVGADGIVVERLDFVFDRVELNAALDLALS